jgi:hypothetical protein
MKTFIRFAPLVLSVLALAVVIEGVLQFGNHPPSDEGWQAHLFQIFVVLEVPAVIAFVAMTWQSWKQNVSLFATHAVVWVAAFATLRIMHY